MWNFIASHILFVFLGRPKERPYVVTFVRPSVCLSVCPSTIWYPLFFIDVYWPHFFSEQLDIWYGGLLWYSEEACFIFDVGGVIVAMVTLVFMELPTFWYP